MKTWNRRSATRSVRFVAMTCFVMLVGACASQRDLPTASLAVARTNLSQAEADNAPVLAPIEYRYATEKLARADAAARDKRYGEARSLADEAAVDAEVAQRKARAVKAANAAAEAQRSNAALRNEATRSTQTTTTETVVTPVATPAIDATRRTTTTTTTVTPRQ